MRTRPSPRWDCRPDDADRTRAGMPGRRHRRLPVALAVALASTLTACTAADHPTAAVPSSAPSATASPTPSLPAPAPSPTPPPEMTRDDETGAAAAARYFVDDLYRYTESTQETDAWSAMSHESCIFCKSVLDDVAALRAARRVTYPAPVRIASQTVQRLNPLAYTVTIDVRTGPDGLWSTDGTLIDPGSSHGGRMTLVMVNQQRRWLTREVQLDQTS